MKPIKMFGLAALAALLAMAFAGASSAKAENTALCKAEEETCSEANTISHVHETSVGKGVLKSSLPTIECTVLFLGDVDSAEVSALVISGQFTYTSCNNFCSVKEESANAVIEVLKTASELASVTGEGLVNVKCPFINCNYIGTGLEGHALGPLTSEKGANGSVVLTEQLTEKESGSCPKEAFLTLTTTPLEKAYLSRRLGYCVRTEHTNGIYTDSTCKELGASGEHKYAYTLIWGPKGLVENQVKCYRVLRPYYGLWRNRTCTTDDLGTPTISAYELGKVETVE
jgi:hypothetical protein